MTHTNTHRTILHLSLIEDVGPTCVQDVVSKIGDEAQFADLYSMLPSDFVHRFGISPAKAAKIVAGLADTRLLEQELRLIEQHRISWCTFIDPEYPEQLKTINAPPAVLYWLGAPIHNEQKRIAIIGARKADQYGQGVIEQLVPPLVKQNWVIVSGGAIGADSMAHQATLNAGGKTIVVVGSGLLHHYPASNKHLFKQVEETGGTMLSIFPVAMQAFTYNFPARNRIISGLSKGCVVIQAAKKSGTHITAVFALDQGRDVFAVPGPIDYELSAGCHSLIQQGAKLVTCAQDILQEYGEVAEPAPKKEQQLRIEPAVALSPAQLTIFTACAQLRSVEELLEVTGMPLSELHTHLFDLQLQGILEQDFTGAWKVAP